MCFARFISIRYGSLTGVMFLFLTHYQDPTSDHGSFAALELPEIEVGKWKKARKRCFFFHSDGSTWLEAKLTARISGLECSP